MPLLNYVLIFVKSISRSLRTVLVLQKHWLIVQLFLPTLLSFTMFEKPNIQIVLQLVHLVIHTRKVKKNQMQREENLQIKMVKKKIFSFQFNNNNLIMFEKVLAILLTSLGSFFCKISNKQSKQAVFAILLTSLGSFFCKISNKQSKQAGWLIWQVGHFTTLSKDLARVQTETQA